MDRILQSGLVTPEIRCFDGTLRNRLEAYLYRVDATFNEVLVFPRKILRSLTCFGSADLIAVVVSSVLGHGQPVGYFEAKNCKPTAK